MSGQVADASRSPPPAPVNATYYTLTCSGFAGKLHFDPPVHSGTGPFPVTVKGGAKGCTAQPNGGGTPVDISIGKVTGSFTIDEGNDQSDCDVFIGGGATNWRVSPRWPAVVSHNIPVQQPFTSFDIAYLACLVESRPQAGSPSTRDLVRL